MHKLKKEVFRDNHDARQDRMYEEKEIFKQIFSTIHRSACPAFNIIADAQAKRQTITTTKKQSTYYISSNNNNDSEN